MEPKSEDKIVDHELLIEDISEDNKVIPILEDTGAGEISSAKTKAD